MRPCRAALQGQARTKSGQRVIASPEPAAADVLKLLAPFWTVTGCLPTGMACQHA